VIRFTAKQLLHCNGRLDYGIDQLARSVAWRQASVVKTTAVDIRELARFILVGITATVGNIGAVWLARIFVTFEIALFAGIGVGLAISFTLSKLFAFDSRSWDSAVDESVRFLIVYAVGCMVYWAVTVTVGRFLVTQGVLTDLAEFSGIIVGAGTMMLTSYFGHRFFTYRTHQRDPAHLRDAS
jgi:putative flippase GtrA